MQVFTETNTSLIMNRLIGKKVIYKNQIEGTIIKVQDTEKGVFISVELVNGETKTFAFPTAIGKSLSTNDDEITSISKDIESAKENARIQEEEKRKSEELKKKKRTSKFYQVSGDAIISEIDWERDFNDKTNRIFKVHQGQTFDEEHRGRYAWAPADGIYHHEMMTRIEPGDIVFHYADGAVVAISEAMAKCFKYPQPIELSGHGWGSIGYRVELKYHILDVPFSLKPYRVDIVKNRAAKYSSFKSDGEAVQGYMFELENELAILFANELLKIATTPSAVKTVLRRI